MPNLFRNTDGTVRKPGVPIPFQYPDGRVFNAVWAGSATEEKLNWWLSAPGNELVQSELVTEIAVRDDKTKEIRWGDAPAGARLLFVLAAPEPGKNYRLAKIVTTAANAAQFARFHHHRFSLFGKFQPDGRLQKIAPVVPPLPEKPQQGELF
jgi:hypothetical protein